jgi:hypothetical protein
MMRLVLISISLIGVPGAAHGAPTTAPATQTSPQGKRSEITDDPKVLFDRSMPAERYTLHGIGVGDDAARIDRAGADERAAGEGASWLRFKSGDAFLIRDGRVARIAVGDAELLRKLNIPDERTLLQKFGRPDEVSEIGKAIARNYLYTRRGLFVQWSPKEQRVISVTLGK